MKFVTLALTAAAAQVILAQPHGHSHVHRRHAKNINVVKRDTETVYVDEAGKVLSVENVCAGIAGGKLKFAEGEDTGVCEQAAALAAPSIAPQEFYEEVPAAPTAVPEPEPAPAAPSPPQTYSGGQGVDSDYTDGSLDCGTFPSEFGALPLDYLGLGGWAGIQKVTYSGDFVSNIVTGISGDSCSEGDMCSYACPPGYLKSQWPSTQGATGQSVGGLQCSGGKLKLTNAGLSPKLCIPGTGGVKATNKAGSVVSICRTDYPGTESETIPTAIQPGETQELACPDSHTYYKWKDMATSAQYYLNPIGVGPEKGCQWGDGSQPIGNWAPINFGVSKKDGTTWLSIFQNKPTTYEKYQGTVEITGDIVGTCKYENGQYCGATGCNADGCTVSLSAGEANYVVS